MSFNRYISVDPNICHGKPCFKGHRIPIGLVVELLGSGVSIDTILADYYPQLNRRAIQVALDYAVSLIERQQVPIAHA